MSRTKQVFRVEPEGGDSYLVVDGHGVANTVYRFADVSHPLAALCECGGADDNRSATPPCLHIRAVEIFVFQHNAHSLLGAEGKEAARIARELEALHNIRVNEPASTDDAAKSKRCPHYKLIRRFYAICRERGLDTTEAARARMRHAMETAMNRCVNSRSEISGSEWKMLGDAIKEGRLAW